VPTTAQGVMVPAVAVRGTFIGIHPAGMAWRLVGLAGIAVPAVAAVIKHPHAGQTTPVTRAERVACIVVMVVAFAANHQRHHTRRRAVERNVQRLGGRISE